MPYRVRFKFGTPYATFQSGSNTIAIMETIVPGDEHELVDGFHIIRDADGNQTAKIIDDIVESVTAVEAS